MGIGSFTLNVAAKYGLKRTFKVTLAMVNDKNPESTIHGAATPLHVAAKVHITYLESKYMAPTSTPFSGTEWLLTQPSLADRVLVVGSWAKKEEEGQYLNCRPGLVGVPAKRVDRRWLREGKPWGGGR